MSLIKSNIQNDQPILIIGLGNPGSNYTNTRHNIGFIAVDTIMNNYNFANFNNTSKFSAEISQGVIAGCKVLLVKPTTFMNLSGQAVQKIKSFYKIDLTNIIVIHDDIDLEFSKVKVKIGGGHGGHNGLRSLDSHIGKDYLRLRLGVGRPINKEDVANYVLDNFARNEMKYVQDLVKSIAVNIPELLTNDFDKFLKNIQI